MVAGATLVMMAFGIAAAVVATRRPPAPVALAPTERSRQSRRCRRRRWSARRHVSYRVQRGDSLWRIAASLTGDGRRWRELWPQLDAAAGRITPGTVLEVDVGRVAAAR
jgi:nucleoid-associated protein YgaU